MRVTLPAVMVAPAPRAISAGRRVVLAAMAGNLLITVTKLAAGLWTGSSAMLSEAVHSLVDTANQALLLLGLRRARRGATRDHPFGYGRELYFWAFVVAVLLFGAGAGWSCYEGLHSLMNPVPRTGGALVNYVVLGASALFETGSWLVAMREFGKTRGDRPFLAALHRSKDPAVFVALVEDTAALIGIAIAFIGVLLADLLDQPAWDSAASVAIGLLLAGVAAFLAHECKSLLIGESAAPELVAAIRDVIARDPRVVRVGEVMTSHLGPDDVFLAVEVDFEDALPAVAIERAIAELEAAVRALDPAVRRIFIEARALAAPATETSGRFPDGRVELGS